MLAVDETVRRGDFAAVAGHELATILEQAEQRGLATGIVTTTTVTHATPAATYAHSPERDWENDARLSPAAREAGFPDIARQLVEMPHGDGIEVVLGGGRANFRPGSAADPEYPIQKGARLDGRDLVEEWRKRAPRSVVRLEPRAVRRRRPGGDGSPARPVRARLTCSSKPTARATPRASPRSRR